MTATAGRRERPRYGIDAPGVIAGFLLGGGVGAAGAGFALGDGAAATWRPVLSALLTTGAILAIEGLLMLAYSLAGKYRQRDRMLAALEWRGDERVLDVGSGRGLLAIGAARRGLGVQVVGIDLWSAKDLSSNSAAAARRNAELEEVAERVEIRDGDARQLDFPDASFDVVLSNLCLHNIAGAADRARACREIARVLRPGGVALVSDFRHTGDYARELAAAGLEVRRGRLHALTTFPPLRVVRATRPAAP
jgi:SAM-dependent methyltransferase